MSLQTITHTVNDILTWVKRQFGDESGAQITDADIIRWLNAAQLEVATLADAIQAVSNSTLVAGTFQYAMPTENAIKIVSLTVDGLPVKALEFQMANDLIAQEDPKRVATGTPYYYWRFANQLYFYPTPDSTKPVALYYMAAPAQVSTGTDALGLPDKYFEALVQYIMMKAYELDEDFSAMQTAKQAFNDRLGLGMEDDTRGSVEFYPTITVLDDEDLY